MTATRLLAVPLAIASTLAAAQQPAATPPTPGPQTQPAQTPSGTQPMPGPNGTYTITRTARIVILDMVVTDAKGNVVTDLSKDDFHVTEMDEPQTVVNFEAAGAHVTPAGTDVVTFRIEGAGASFSRSYSADPNSTPRDLGYAWFQDTDDTSASYVTLTQPGSFQYWVELNGVKSKVLTFTAVTWLDGNPPASGAGGGSGANTGGGSGSSGDAPRSGCASVGGALMLGVLALLRRRR